MTYSKKTLVILGKQVVKKHPEIATALLSDIRPVPKEDLSKIPGQFTIYCQQVGATPETIQGPVYKSSQTELKKVFVSAMAVIYENVWGLGLALANILLQDPRYTYRMLNEVRFRYEKDQDFKQKVDQYLQIISPTTIN